MRIGGKGETMSILIKGIDMPKGDTAEVIIRIQPNGEVRDSHGILLDVEAIQIPTPHGRLIDEKTLDDTIERLHILTRYEHKIVSNILFETPTILEAEGNR